MFTFNRNEQVVILLLCGALLIGAIISYLDLTDPESIPEFEVRKNAVPVPPLPTTTEQPQQRININQATEEELQALPGIGPAMARRIIAYRETNGPFVDVEGLIGVKGIGPKTLNRIKPRLAPIVP